MIAKTVLPFKLEMTHDVITPRAGLALFGEFYRALGLEEKIEAKLPRPGSGAGYRPSSFVAPLLLMLQGGGRSIEDLRWIRKDRGLCDLMGIERVPSSDAYGAWLRRMGRRGGLGGLAAVNRELLRVGTEEDEQDDYTLDIDATEIVAEKKEAKRTYKGNKGYMPIVGHLAENGMVVGDEFRPGNESPASRNLAFIEYCANRMPPGKRIAHLRSDSAAYQAKIINWCEDNGVSYAIGADLDRAVMGAIEAIPESEWRPYRKEVGRDRSVEMGKIAETIHTMNATHTAFRLVVIRRPVQLKLIGENDPRSCYTAIASNRCESAEETPAWYNQRGETSENRIKELKAGFGMERMPCGKIQANAVFFRIGVLAYNLFILMKIRILPEAWRRFQVQTIRWRFYQTAGRIVYHARSLTLKVNRWAFHLFEGVRMKCCCLAPA